MFNYTISDFLWTGEVRTFPEYSNDEYMHFLNNFDKMQFNSPKEIKSITVQLLIPSTSRICNVYLFDQTADELDAYSDGKMPGPLGHLQLTLWREKGPEIISNFF